MKDPEQRAKGDAGAYSKHLKKHSTRIVRRAAKRDPENAPKKKHFRGYST